MRNKKRYSPLCDCFLQRHREEMRQPRAHDRARVNPYNPIATHPPLPPPVSWSKTGGKTAGKKKEKTNPQPISQHLISLSLERTEQGVFKIEHCLDQASLSDPFMLAHHLEVVTSRPTHRNIYLPKYILTREEKSYQQPEPLAQQPLTVRASRF